MEEFDHEDMTPFGLQTTNNRRRRRRSQPSFPLFNTGILIILLLVIAFAFIFIIIPSFLSLTSKIFKPQLVKKSWDSVNLVLVLFAIICAFLGKNNSNNNDNNDTPRSTYEDYKYCTTPKHVHDDHVRRSNPSTPRQWSYDDYSSSSDRAAYNSLRRLRSSSSYPDLRQEFSWTRNGDDRWRFYDDSRLYDWRKRSRRGHEDQEHVYFNHSKDITVDTVHASPPLASPPQPASVPPTIEAATESAPPPPQSTPPQRPKFVRRKPKRTYEDVKPEEKSERKEVMYSELKIKHSLPPTSPPAKPPPPPPPPPPISRSEKRSNKSEKKRGGVTKEFLISLRRKRKKQRQRSVENLDEFFNLSTLPLYPSPPPPPPPPPLPSFYQIFSSKKNKARKHHSVPPPPPPPPPPLPASLEARASKKEPHKAPVTIQKPPLPVKIRNVSNAEESFESGNESPLNSIPPPPPLPPFKMLPPWKFEVHGDFVRLKSINSSRSGSPDFDDPLSSEASPSDGDKTGHIDGGESTAGPLFCPSPDVNTKADNFIARFRAGLKLEKTNSVNGRSNLAPNPGPSTM